MFQNYTEIHILSPQNCKRVGRERPTMQINSVPAAAWKKISISSVIEKLDPQGRIHKTYPTGLLIKDEIIFFPFFEDTFQPNFQSGICNKALLMQEKNVLKTNIC